MSVSISPDSGYTVSEGQSFEVKLTCPSLRDFQDVYLWINGDAYGYLVSNYRLQNGTTFDGARTIVFDVPSYTVYPGSSGMFKLEYQIMLDGEDRYTTYEVSYSFDGGSSGGEGEDPPSQGNDTTIDVDDYYDYIYDGYEYDISYVCRCTKGRPQLKFTIYGQYYKTFDDYDHNWETAWTRKDFPLDPVVLNEPEGTYTFLCDRAEILKAFKKYFNSGVFVLREFEFIITSTNAQEADKFYDSETLSVGDGFILETGGTLRWNTSTPLKATYQENSIYDSFGRQWYDILLTCDFAQVVNASNRVAFYDLYYSSTREPEQQVVEMDGYGDCATSTVTGIAGDTFTFTVKVGCAGCDAITSNTVTVKLPGEYYDPYDPDNNTFGVRIYQNGIWEPHVIFCYQNGSWNRCNIFHHQNGELKPCTF